MMLGKLSLPPREKPNWNLTSQSMKKKTKQYRNAKQLKA